jgi:hypothetical protein
MLESIRRVAAVPRVPAKYLFAAGTTASFAWLLAQDLIHPVVVYALELYLIF